MRIKLAFLLLVTLLVCLVSCDSASNGGSGGDCNVHFYDRGNLYILTSVDEGELISEPDAPVREGFDFLGWYSSDKEWDFSTDIAEADITLTAKWRPNFELLFPGCGTDGINLSKDGACLVIDTNPDDKYCYQDERILVKIKNLNKELGIPDSLYQEMLYTPSGKSGTYTENEYVTVEWTSSVQTGIVITYKTEV